MIRLTEPQRRHLRRLGHPLKPVVRTGALGLTDAVLAEIDAALAAHELIKVKLVSDDREQRRQYAERICEACSASLVQSIGHVALLYRSNPGRKRPIALP